MGSYQQFVTGFKPTAVRRVTWVCGDQRVLVEEVIDAVRTALDVKDLDYVSISAGPQFDAQVWAEANQYPLIPGAHRLILIRDAEKLNLHHGQLGDWLARTRQLPGVYLLFASNESDLPHSTVAGRKVVADYIQLLRGSRGSMVRCSMPAEADAIAWARRHADLDEDTARYLLDRCGGNLRLAKGVCMKLALFDGQATTDTIDLLCAERPSDDFTETLLKLDARRAMLCIPDLRVPEMFAITALLDSRLDLLARLHREQAAGSSWRDITGISPFLVRAYMPIAHLYSPEACLPRRQILAVVDDALHNGARAGTMEALVAMWCLDHVPEYVVSPGQGAA